MNEKKEGKGVRRKEKIVLATYDIAFSFCFSRKHYQPVAPTSSPEEFF